MSDSKANLFDCNIRGEDESLLDLLAEKFSDEMIVQGYTHTISRQADSLHCFKLDEIKEHSIKNTQKILEQRNEINLELEGEQKSSEHYLHKKRKTSQNGNSWDQGPLQNFQQTAGQIDASSKAFVLEKVNKILSSTDLSKKIMLYLIISKSSDENIVSQLASLDTDITSEIIKDNDDQCEQTKKDDFERIRLTIDNFCKYLFNNGYSISPENEINRNIFNLKHKAKNKQQSKTNLEWKKEKDCKFEDVDGSDNQPQKSWLCPHFYRIQFSEGKCKNCFLKENKRYVEKKSNMRNSCSNDSKFSCEKKKKKKK